MVAEARVEITYSASFLFRYRFTRVFAKGFSSLSFSIASFYLVGPDHFRITSVPLNCLISPPGENHLPANFNSSCTNSSNSDRFPFQKYPLPSANKLDV